MVGLGIRSEMYSEAIVEKYPESCQLVGLCDTNAGRLQDRVEWAEAHQVKVTGYNSKRFEQMIEETKPDCVIVTTIDCFHDEYICRSMELGCDVITEKPMTIDEIKCQRIIDTQKKTGKKCRVTFNYRYAPPRTQVKEILMAGVIGNILSVDFHWVLDREHGADYFRRWHRNKTNSGGLMVHKATHHFDLVNWWLSTTPKSVFAMGHRKFYTPKMADRFGLKNRANRCLNCPEAAQCAFFLDLKSFKELKRLYLENEHHDGYFRDQCVFSNKIDIEDTVVATVDYHCGAKLSYSLNSFMPWEGYMVVLNGTKGRLEHKCEEQVYISGDGSLPGSLKQEGTWIRIYPIVSPAYEIEVWGGAGGHGGADPIMLEDIFQPKDHQDKYMRMADHRAGAYSIVCGIAANHSLHTGKLFYIDDLIKNINKPDYPETAPEDEAIVMKRPNVQSWLHK
jgi:predicted dehydrogenase